MSMYKDPISRKVIDLLGNTSLSMPQKTWAVLKSLHELENPNDIPQGIKVALECCGLAPRHETALPYAVPEFEQSLIDSVTQATHDKVEHRLKGWFQIDADRPLDKKLTEICIFLEEFTDEREKAIVFQSILNSKFIPIPVYYFSRDTSESSDDLILREYASEYIQLRQLLNMKVDPTSRGSLILDFIASLTDKPHAQAVVLGSFVEELLRRLRGNSEPDQHDTGMNASTPESTPPFSATFPIDPNMDPEQIKEMIKNFKGMLPPGVLEQLRKLFGDKGFDL